MYTYAQLNTTKAPFDNLAVRKAFFYAVPYQQILNEVYHGRAKQAMGFLDPNGPNRKTEGLLEHTYDAKKAMSILSAAGISTPVKARIIMSSATPDLEQVALQIKSFGKDAGFDFSLDVVPTPIAEESTVKKTFEVRLWRDFVISYESVPYTLEIFNTRLNPANNYTGWGPPEYYATIDAGVAAGDSLSPEAAKYWHKAELIWQEGYHTIEVANPQPLAAFRSTLTGYAQRTNNDGDWSTVKFAK
jgi:peptide/nickel transport system substrate-binding protein